jgi:thiamine biosynthesis lipoprotein
MGTTAEITLFARNKDRGAELMEAAFGEIERVEALLSSYRPGSEVTRINRHAARGPVTTDPETFGLIERALEYSEITHGAFDVTVGRLLKAWGFFGGTGHTPSAEELRAAREASGWKGVTLSPDTRSVRFRKTGLELDFGGMGKGWALDRAAALLKGLGVNAALLGLGKSSYYAMGSPPGKPGWLIVVPDPNDPGEPLSCVYLKDGALSTSGSAQRSFEVDSRRYSHILDPRTGQPSSGLVQVTVTAKTTTESDVFSTAIFVLGPEEAKESLNAAEGVSALLVMEAERASPAVIMLEWPERGADPILTSGFGGCPGPAGA